MTTGCYETSFLLFANSRGPGALLTVKCPAPGTHRETNAGVCPGGMLAVRIDSHIIVLTIDYWLHTGNTSTAINVQLFSVFLKDLLPCIYTGRLV